jgi:PAS domain S-box-containing protein
MVIAVNAARGTASFGVGRRGQGLWCGEGERRFFMETSHAAARAVEATAQEYEQIIATLQRVGTALTAERDLHTIVQIVTDAGTELSGAQFGAFFYNVLDEAGESYMLYTLSGVPPDNFSRFPMPRNTLVFDPTFRGEGTIRLDDVTKDERYGKNEPYFGMPPGHLPVRSYLAVPVVSRSGEVLGGLFFGHSTPGVFTERQERIIAGIAAHAAIAIDNARLYEAQQRARAEADAAEVRYRSLFRAIRDVILVTDDEMRYVDVNPAATDLLGYTRDELLQMHIPDISPYDTHTVAEMFDQFAREGFWRGEFDLRRKDGSIVPTEGVAVPVGLASGVRFVAVIRDITERREHERMRQEFLARVAHELRTPLTALIGYMQLMKRRGIYDDRMMTTMNAQTQHLARLVDDMLEMTRIDAGRLSLHRTQTELVWLAREIIERVRITARNTTIALDTAAPEIVGMWDAARLGQVLYNLLDNAIKYSPAGGTITVRIGQDAETARVSVTDQGIGISADDMPHLFEQFYRGTPTLERTVKGFGIGLSVCKELVEAHGGDIWAESTPGEGSTFTFTLPQTPVADAPNS